MSLASSVDSLRRRIAPLQVVLSDETIEKLLAYMALLQKWNSVFNLTAIREQEQMLVQHLFDSLAILPTFDSLAPRTVLDVGSGGGLPGIVIAITRPDWAVSVNDIVSKKTAFLLQVKAALALSNVDVINARVETIKPDRCFDIITCRAFADLKVFYQLSQHLLAPRGYMVAMKGVQNADEIRRLAEFGLATRIVPLDVPEFSGHRHLVIANKSSAGS